MLQGNECYDNRYAIDLDLFVIKIMITFRRAASLFLRTNTRTVTFNFSGDKWKERDQAAEKVFITQNERDTLKKLLKKVEEDEEEWQENCSHFESQLRDICKQHKVDNEPFISEVTNLHRMLSD